MKKIGIVTWYKYLNYGTVLQAYAVQWAVGKLGYNPEIIAYEKRGDSSISRRVSYILRNIIWRLPSILVRKLFKKEYDYRKRAFREFVDEKMSISREYGSLEEIKGDSDSYEAFICGSDQIWAPTVFDPVYFLDFAEEEKKKIAYAPSIGLSTIPEDKSQQMAPLINKIDYISIRERQGKQLISSLTGREAEVVLDPTLLLDKEKWDEIAIPPNISEPYILCYFLGNKAFPREYAQRLKALTGYKLVVIPFVNKDLFFGDIRKVAAGPREFLGLIGKASLVCTDSFHGVAFSINYEKNFLAFRRFDDGEFNSQNSRIYNILENLKITDRLVTEGSSMTLDKINIDYKSVNSLLSREREKSFNYLRSSLEG